MRWVKNKFYKVFTKKGRSENANVTKQNAEYTPTVNTLENIIKKKRGTSRTQCPQGPATPIHNPLDQVKTSKLELDEAAVEVKQYEEFRELDVLLQI
jgi:hypothetical protein